MTKPTFVRLSAAKPPRTTKTRRKTTTAGKLLERPLQRSLVTWLRYVLPHGSLVAAAMNEAPATAATELGRARFHLARKASGVLPGMPDLTIMLPGGHVVFFETKRPTGILSIAQQKVHAELAAIGHRVAVVTSLESARHALLGWGMPLREERGMPVAPPKFKLAKRKPLDDAVPF